MEKEFVFCEVATDCLYTKFLSVGSGGYLPASHRGGRGLIPVHVRLLVDKLEVGQEFSSCTSVFPCQCHSTVAPHSSSSTRCFYQMDKRAKRGNLPK
jgi:hypothetical protein